MIAPTTALKGCVEEAQQRTKNSRLCMFSASRDWSCCRDWTFLAVADARKPYIKFRVGRYKVDACFSRGL